MRNSPEEFLRRRRIYAATFVPTSHYKRPPASFHWDHTVFYVADYRTKKAFVLCNKFQIDQVHLGFMYNFFDRVIINPESQQYQDIIKTVQNVRSIYERQKVRDQERQKEIERICSGK